MFCTSCSKHALVFVLRAIKKHHSDSSEIWHLTFYTRIVDMLASTNNTVTLRNSEHNLEVQRNCKYAVTASPKQINLKRHSRVSTGLKSMP
jgi:ribosomal protein S10